MDKKNKITSIIIELDNPIDVSFEFDSDPDLQDSFLGEQFASTEFRKGTKTKKLLNAYEDAIIPFIEKLVKKLGREV